ncbi:hypothetical protein H0H93_006281 [Arthromyces matolae]|nr:hypothetical protein H0H93_006281 [Arthromyces matolae]
MNHPLQPRTPLNRFVALVEANKKSEGRINGVWESILNRHFSTAINSARMTLSPELRVGKSHMFADLILEQNLFTVDPHNINERKMTRSIIPVLIYEGKSEKGQGVVATLEQLIDYADELLKKRTETYLIAVKGVKCWFWKCKKDDGNVIRVMGMQSINGQLSYKSGANQSVGNRPIAKALDIREYNDALVIKAFLKQIG